MSANTSTTPAIGFQTVLSAISEQTRWRILRFLLNEPLTSSAVARRLGITVNAASKHMKRLCQYGIIQCRDGNVYHLVQAFRIPGTSTLDFGVAVIHLDKQPD